MLDIHTRCYLLSQTPDTITSPFFSEFVLQAGRVFETRGPAHGAWRRWGIWTELDRTSEKLDIEMGFRVVIRVENLDRELDFFSRAGDRSPRRP